MLVPRHVWPTVDFTTTRLPANVVLCAVLVLLTSLLLFFSWTHASTVRVLERPYPFTP